MKTNKLLIGFGNFIIIFAVIQLLYTSNSILYRWFASLVFVGMLVSLKYYLNKKFGYMKFDKYIYILAVATIFAVTNFLYLRTGVTHLIAVYLVSLIRGIIFLIFTVYFYRFPSENLKYKKSLTFVSMIIGLRSCFVAMLYFAGMIAGESAFQNYITLIDGIYYAYLNGLLAIADSGIYILVGLNFRNSYKLSDYADESECNKQQFRCN